MASTDFNYDEMDLEPKNAVHDQNEVIAHPLYVFGFYILVDRCIVVRYIIKRAIAYFPVIYSGVAPRDRY